MKILWLLIIPVLYILIRLVLYLIVRKYGKFSYDGFSAVGFAYNAEKDIFYSTKNAWQKHFGYTYIYDVLAPIFRMIVDTEPIRFFYNNKNWLITLWKGQYGIVTGAEIGVYYTNQKKVNKKTVYFPVNDSEMLNMSLILYKNGEVIAKAYARHWWLAIFKLGMFSRPSELSMDINITFLNHEMLDAFIESFKKIGYTSENFKVIDNTFCFKYTKSRTRKVWTRSWIADNIRQIFNRKNVDLYNKYLADYIDDNKIDDSRTPVNQKLIMVNELLPDLLKNNPEIEKKSERTIKNISNEKEKNVVLLNSDIYSNNGANKI